MSEFSEPSVCFDVAVLGAGPAGLAAAGEAAGAGADVLLVDAGGQLGGQYWRHSETSEVAQQDSGRFHHGWGAYLRLSQAVEEGIVAGRITYRPSTHVWSVESSAGSEEQSQGFTLHTVPVPEALNAHTSQGGSQRFEASALILCPGAYDRQLPVPGWTLPGVMAAGGVQAFIKTQGIAPGRRIILGGTGPFLLSAAASVLHAGAEVVGICESADLTGWVPRGAAAALVPSKGLEGAEYAALLARHRVPYRRRSVITAIHGSTRARAVTFSQVGKDGTPVAGTERRVDDIDVVGLGWGFIPQAELLVQLDVETRVDVDGSLVGVVDAKQAASLPGLYLAGEITGVAGAAAAVVEGRVAGRAAAGQTRPRRRGERLQKAAHSRFARAMHHAHRLPEGWRSWLEDDTVICRCEEVPWEQVRSAVQELRATDPRTLKGSTRTGMGWCQGRVCGTASSCLNGNRPEGGDEEQVGLTDIARRPLALPVAFQDLAGGSRSAPLTDISQPPYTTPHDMSQG